MSAVTSKAKRTGILKWLRGVAVGGLLSLKIMMNPKPAGRPRVTPHGVYYLKSHAEAYRVCQEQIAHLRSEASWPKGPLAGPLAVVVECVAQRPKVTKLSAPRGDVDNFAKLPLDACTKAGIWVDDSQVETLVSSKRWTEDGEDPHLLIHIGMTE